MGTQIPKAYNSLGPDDLKDDTVNINFAAGGCGLLNYTMPIPVIILIGVYFPVLFFVSCFG